MQMRGYIITFKCLSHFVLEIMDTLKYKKNAYNKNKINLYYLSPRRQFNIINNFAFLCNSQFKFFVINQEIAIHHIELWNQLLEIISLINSSIPSSINTSKYPICWAKYSILQPDNKFWYFSN